MDVKSASKAWHISEATIWDYVRKGFIRGLSFEDNRLCIPNLPKPYVAKIPPSGAEKTDERILSVLDRGLYATANSMKIEASLFSARL